MTLIMTNTLCIGFRLVRQAYKKSYVAIVLYFSTRDLPDIATSEKKKKKKKSDQLSRFSSKSFVEKKKKT